VALKVVSSQTSTQIERNYAEGELEFPFRNAGDQDHEVSYASGKTGASKDQVKAAVKSVCNSRKKIEVKLAK